MPYFKTSHPAAITAFREWRASIANHYKAALALSAEVGASPERCCRYNDGKFVAFIFEPGQEIPAYFRPFRHFAGAYVPRLTTKEGKQLREKIRKLPSVLMPNNYNKAIGFSPCLISGMRFCEYPASVLQGDTLYFMLPDDAPYTPPENVTEIFGSEYNQAMKAVEDKKR